MEFFDYKFSTEFNELKALSLLNHFHRNRKVDKTDHDHNIWERSYRNPPWRIDPYVEIMKCPAAHPWCL